MSITRASRAFVMYESLAISLVACPLPAPPGALADRPSADDSWADREEATATSDDASHDANVSEALHDVPLDASSDDPLLDRPRDVPDLDPSEGDINDQRDAPEEESMPSRDAAEVDAIDAADGSADRDGHAASVDGATFDCNADAACACVVADVGSALGRAIATGTMVGRTDAARGTCGGASMSDAAVLWTAPTAGTFSFDTAGSDTANDTVLHVHRNTCNGPEFACNNNASGAQSAVRVTLGAGERVVVVVESRTPSLRWMLNARDVTRCPDRDLGSATGRVASGLVGPVGGSLFANCSPSGRDVSFRWTPPSTGMWRFDTTGSDYDTVLHVRDGVCGAIELGCNDDVAGGPYMARVDLSLAAGRTVTVVVSGFNARPEGPGPLPAGGTGAYVLNIVRM